MSQRTIIGEFTDKLGQRMVIYSEFCKNYWLVEGYGINGELLFTNERIDYWEYRSVVERFMGMRLRDINASYYAKPITAPVKTTEVKGTQTAMVLERGPVMSQAQLNKEIQKLRLIVA